MNLTTRQLEALVAVGERGNISHAAVALDMTQPALSRTISRVEEEVGAQLFHRDARGVTPTEAGRMMLDTARQLLDQLAATGDEIKSLDGQLSGSVCVVMPETAGAALFVPLIDRVGSHYPEVDLRVMSQHPNAIAHTLQSGEADVGVVSGAHRTAGLELAELATESLHLVSADMPDSMVRAGSVPLSALAGVPLTLPALRPGLRPLIEAEFARHGIQPNVLMNVDSQEALIELVATRNALSIMSYAGIHRYVEAGEFRSVEIVDTPIRRTLHTALPRSRPPTRLMAVLEAELHTLANELAASARWSCPASPGD